VVKPSALVLTAGLLWATLAGALTREVPSQYASIQAAVDAAAAGDTVRVAAGEFEEQVVITSDLVLLGDGVGLTTVQAPTSLPHDVGNFEYRPVICVQEPAQEVEVAGLTIDGLKRHPETGRFVGLIYWHTGGVARDLEVVNVHPWPTTEDITGVGILASMPFNVPPRPLRIENVQVRRFQKSGVVVSGPFQAVVEGVTVDTDGVYSDAVQNGIELNFVSTSRVTDCEVRNLTYDGTPYPDLTAVGLLAYFAPDITVSDCRALECQTGNYLVASSGRLDRLQVVAPPTAVTYCNGLVAVDWIGRAQPAGEPIIPEPRPTVNEGSPPERPQFTWELELRDSDFQGGGLASSRGVAVGSFGAEALDLVAERCVLKGWETGVIALEAGLSAVYGRLSGCRIENNQSFGVYAAILTPLDARGCWWGDVTGPYNPLTNPQGLGDTAGDNVLFDPWVVGNVVPLPVPQTISLADQDGSAYTDTISVDYLGGAEANLYAFSARLEWDPDVVRSASIERPGRGGFADAVAFQTIPEGDHAVVVDAAIGGARPGIPSGPLFVVHFEAVGTPDWTESPLTLSLLQTRDGQNQPVGGFVGDAGKLTVDLQPPVVSAVEVRNESLSHTDLYAKDGDLVSIYATVTDGDPAFGRDSVRGLPATVWNSPFLYTPPDAYVAPQAIWSARPASLVPPDGLAIVYVEARDPSGNFSTQLSDTITADNTLPAAVTNFAAAPDHNAVHLSWDEATGNDLNYRRTMVRAFRRGDYPFYDTEPPGYPQDLSEGELVHEGDGGTADPIYADDGSERDILSFAVLVEDMAGNVSPVESSSRGRATNYRLADVRGHPAGSPGDGVIDIYDVSRLGDTYGLLRAEAGFDGDCDVGPLDGEVTNIPVPDEQVEFEDLMVFADQFALDAAPPAPGGAAAAELAWHQLAPDTWALELTAPCPRLKGLRLEGDAGDAVLTLTAGPLLHAQPRPWFLHPARGGLSAHLAVLGHGAGLAGTGELLRFTANEPVELPVPRLELRDVDNQRLETTLPTAVGDEGAVPRVFRVAPARPNPFNPSTEIAFDLPGRQRVRLAIHDLAGRRVATLVDAELPAARHAVRWQGRDDRGRLVAAGTYLYRLEAGPWSASGKLQLVK
jgi:hypothetical protein